MKRRNLKKIILLLEMQRYFLEFDHLITFRFMRFPRIGLHYEWTISLTFSRVGWVFITQYVRPEIISFWRNDSLHRVIATHIREVQVRIRPTASGMPLSRQRTRLLSGTTSSIDHSVLHCAPPLCVLVGSSICSCQCVSTPVRDFFFQEMTACIYVRFLHHMLNYCISGNISESIYKRFRYVTLTSPTREKLLL